MNPVELQRKLIAAARGIPPDERVPYAFEKRIMARLAGARADVLAVWARGLWRAAFSCVFITLLSTAWAVWVERHPAPIDLTQEFETAVFASTSPDEAW